MANTVTLSTKGGFTLTRSDQIPSIANGIERDLSRATFTSYRITILNAAVDNNNDNLVAKWS